jgi:hypothetical protein
MTVIPSCESLKSRLRNMTDKYATVVEQVTATKNQELLDFCARRLVEIAAHTIMGHLLLQDASNNELFSLSAQVYVRYAEAEVEKHTAFICQFDKDDLAYYKQ